MKYCPECDSDFPDSDRFCELDGTALVPANPDPEFQPGMNWKLVAVAVSGVVIGVGFFLIYQAMTREPAGQSSNTPSANSSVVMQQQAAHLFSSVPLPVASPSPSVEPSPSPSAMPKPAPQTERRVELSSGAISTDVNKTKSGPLIIRLNDGKSIESDEAWQTGEGIWYRRGSIIALLDPKQVKAIEKVIPADKVTPATPAPSPAQSPTP